MDQENCFEVLLKNESPFAWNLPAIERPIEQFMEVQTEKCLNISEENEFQWTNFTLNLLLAYELCEKLADYEKALDHIDLCLKHIETLTKSNCQEELFSSLKPVLQHVAQSTQAIVLLRKGQIDQARQIISVIKPLGSQDKSGVLGLRAALNKQYGRVGQPLALECAKAARDLDPKEAEWHFIYGNTLGRCRRYSHDPISQEEIIAIKNAYQLRKDATYTVHLAQLYSDQSVEYLYKSYDNYNGTNDKERGKAFAIKSIALFKEGLEMRPDCSSLMARVAHGLLRVKWKDLVDAKYVKKLLSDVLELTPNHGMALHDLGYLYEKFEYDVSKAMGSLQRSLGVGNFRAFYSLISLKWKVGLRSQVINDLEKALNEYKNDNNQAQVSAHLGAMYLLLNSDWIKAINYFHLSLEKDPSAGYLKNYYSLQGKKINLLNLITNEVRQIVMVSNLPVYEEFLEKSRSINIDIFETAPNSREFIIWKTKQLETNNSWK